MNMNYLESDHIRESRIDIDGIPAILMRPRSFKGKLPTVILYHGWSSSKEYQRIRGFIFASLGFQVLLPDAINHGERDPFKVYDLDHARKNFWKTIGKNIEESDSLIRALLEEYDGDQDRIGLVGNSMGGFSASGVFVKHESLKSLVVFNGSCNWAESNMLFSRTLFKDDGMDVLDIGEGLDPYDPSKNLKKLANRPILLLHGTTDSLVPIDGQDSFYDLAKMVYEDSSKLKYIRYNNLNHFVTTNMMEEAIIWFKKHL